MRRGRPSADATLAAPLAEPPLMESPEMELPTGPDPPQEEEAAHVEMEEM